MPAAKKKLRGDSTFSRLTPEQLAEVNDMFLNDGCTYDGMKAHLAGLGLEVSRTSIAEYYNTHVLPMRYARMQRLAANLNANNAGDETLDAATLSAVRQMVMELAVTPGSNPKTLRMLYDIVLKARAQDVDERKMALLEKKAAMAEQAAAAVKNDTMTNDEKLAEVRRIFGMD